jgi:peptidoglycan/xylan/chitin deacetylase (PgdA/CDA1 family)
MPRLQTRARFVAALTVACILAPVSGRADEAPSLEAGPPPGVPVFTYHMVDRRVPGDSIGRALTITPEQFAAQLATLAVLHLHTISAEELVGALRRGHVPERSVVLTFDDGYKDGISEVLPLLRRYHDTATFYIISGTVGTPRHLSWADVRALRNAGMEIGAHGADHVDLRELNAFGQLQQVHHCMRSLERWASVEAETYAYPSGRYNATTLEVMRRARVEAAFTMEPGFVRSLTNPYRLPRIRVLRANAVETFREITATL